MSKKEVASIFIFRKTVLLIGLAILVACGSSSLHSVKTLAKYQETNTADPKSDDSYIIGPGDILAIDVWKEPELSKQITVRLDGKISLPLLYEIQAANLTCVELQDQLTAKLRDFVDVPQVSVILIESHSKKIYILGNVANPGEYKLRKNMTLIQAISLAGGLNQWADSSDIRLIRRIKGVDNAFRIDYDVIISGEDFSQNIQLQPDDTIFVP